MSDAKDRAHDALAELLISGTAPDVVAHYCALAAAAHDDAAATMLSPYGGSIVVCDTETTGLSPRSDALIEIAAVRLDDGIVAGEFHTFVDPQRRIPEDIVELTGITNADVAGAPSAEQAVAAFARFAGEGALVAHNARFDAGFVMAHAAPGQLEGPWVDTLALAQIVLPRLKSHRLHDLSAAFELAEPTHRALADVCALAGVWRVLMEAVRTLPAGLAGAIATLAPGCEWPLRRVFACAAEERPDATFSLTRLRNACAGPTMAAAREDADAVPLEFDSDATIEQAFGKDGIVAGMYAGYEPREAQVAMALDVQAALRDGGVHALEAGTGVGKSMAYLVPLALAARRNHITVGVATKTNALTDQLVYHELPRLAATLDGLRYVTLKGYEHYPCLRKLANALADANAQLDGQELTALAALLVFVSQTPWGDMDALNVHWPGSLRTRLCASSHDCLKHRCSFYPKLCYLHGARCQAAAADIVVTNHALLFRDSAIGGGILPPIRHWVVDEAHAAEAEARKQLSSTMSAAELSRVLERLENTRSGLVATIRAKAASVEGGSMLYGVTASIDEQVGAITALATSFFSYVKELAGTAEDADASYNSVELWVGPQLRASGAWASVERAGRSLVEKLSSLEKRLDDLMSMLEQFEGAFAAQSAELVGLSCSLQEMLGALTLVLDGQDDTRFGSVTLDRRPERMAEALTASTLDIGAELAESFYPNMKSVVFTSATLATGSGEQAFAHFEHAVGLDVLEKERTAATALASGYDFDGHMSVLAAADMPAPGEPGYRDALAELLFGVHVALGGSVLTLFTNRREMEALYRLLKPELSAVGIELSAQLRSTSAAVLRERFCANRTLSLFALRSFWEGFDAPGETLRCVVIPRLPFAKPTDPLSREREHREGRRAWGAYTLPESVIDLKQAAGRLIRSSTDEGWLVLADARVVTRRYGKVFLRAMPTRDVRTLPCEQLLDVLHEQRPGMRE